MSTPSIAERVAAGAVKRGEMYTVTPHVLPHGVKCGTWHCRVTGDVRDGKVIVQEMKVDGTRWRPAMSTCVQVDALVSLRVQVDLFGDPRPPDLFRRPSRRVIQERRTQAGASS